MYCTDIPLPQRSLFLGLFRPKYNDTPQSRIWNYILKKSKISSNLKTQASPSSEFRSLIDQLHGSKYRNDKKYRSDGNCIHLQRKRFFLHNISGKELQRWVQHSPLDRPARISNSWFRFDDIVA